MSFNPERVIAELERQADSRRGSDAFRQVADILKTLPDMTAFLRELLATARRCFFADHAAILNYHAPTDRWYFAARHGVDDAGLMDEIAGISRTVIRQTAKNAGVMLIQDAQNHELTRNSPSIKTYNIQAALCAPIHDNAGNLWGVIYLANAGVPNAFTAEDQRELEQFADFCGACIHFCDEMTRLAFEGGHSSTTADGQFPELKPRSPEMQLLLGNLEKAAGHDFPILLLGEPGVGKDVLARWVHEHSPRHAAPFRTINCAAIPTELLEAELFGVEANSATGVRFREGRIRMAEGGTVLLNEIGDMPLSQQAKLLQVIQFKQLDRVGGDVPIPVDVRFVLATNRDLRKSMDDGTFRRDLFHRISMFTFQVPPLRHRSQDIPDLVTHLLSKICRDLNRETIRVPKSIMNRLQLMPWEGNVRELESFLTRSVILSPGETLRIDGTDHVEAEPVKLPAARRRAGETMGEVLARVEAQLIRKALKDAGGVAVEAAQNLGIPESTLRSKVKRLNLNRPIRLRVK